jgi:hypothetical protein
MPKYIADKERELKPAQKKEKKPFKIEWRSTLEKVPPREWSSHSAYKTEADRNKAFKNLVTKATRGKYIWEYRKKD